MSPLKNAVVLDEVVMSKIYMNLNKPTDLMNLANFPVRAGETVWGGEPGAGLIINYLNAKAFTVYTTESKPALMQKWRLLPDAKGNIQFYEKFWQDDETTNLPVAPILLIYADLMITGDPRNIETAERIYSQYLKED
ncbi:type IV toxin-antitoxin system AbiEi family antitoxin [Pedobacter sp. PLR]|uniref:type IV toxin-antitoxin system AbiEi family antitoxin n=1 Tax=Pedobacter sp. PLR TaxID=2994465 RepID=UPI002247CC8A|nr:type IV toxin-antitoxin system AbiEi family antitoxin [Pedobacter sp. PLR]MCX2453862.1 type IV toxin-antitoxin system AbiEi family antitoxin [Pedobacter sp. PLR]